MTLDLEPLQRIDSFPYRHRISELMTAPVATTERTTTLLAASRRMVQDGIGSLAVVDERGRAIGIITQQHVVGAVAARGGAALDLPVSAAMTTPVPTIAKDSFAFVAFGRMPRLGVRHLLVVDAEQRPCGMVSAWALMRFRAGGALMISDEIAAAGSGAELAAVWRRMPSLVRGLLGEDVPPLDITAVISAVLRDITARAAEIAVGEMRESGWGEAPAPWCVMVLGSGGRGESTLSADQDNAIVYAGQAADDAWFAEVGQRMCTTLAEAGINLCKGGVMAANAAWRRSAEDWLATTDRWIREADGENLLNLDIFIDLQPAYGESALAEDLRRHLLERAARHAPFLQALASSLKDLPVPLTWFGELVTIDGRLSLKTSGLLPLVSTVRLLAVKHHIPLTSTRERLRALLEGGHIARKDAGELREVHATMMLMLLRKQVRDFESGRKLDSQIAPDNMETDERARLRRGFRHIKAVKQLAETALSAV